MDESHMRDSTIGEVEGVSRPELFSKEDGNLEAGLSGDVVAEEDHEHSRASRWNPRLGVVAYCFTAALILAWWICSTILRATRHRWIVQTFWAWNLLLIIAFRFIPNSHVTRPVLAIWQPLVQIPWFSLPYWIRMSTGIVALLAAVFGAGFGFRPSEGNSYGNRGVSVFGLIVFQTGFYLSSMNRKYIPWPTVIIGLIMQQVIAVFALKTYVGFKIFTWIAQLASDFLSQANTGAAFFFSQDVVNQHWFFVNTLAAIIFFIAFIQMMYYLGVMLWIIDKFAWFFYHAMDISGAEAVVATASPWVGLGESACLVKPFIGTLTDSEIHLVMTSAFSTISGSVLSAYIALGIPPANLITASVMSIPASIAISKLRYPETEVPLTKEHVKISRDQENSPANALQAFAQGSLFGLKVAGQILAIVLTIVSLVAVVNGLLTWIGKGFSIHQLTLQLILGYVFYPLTFLMGVPRAEILSVSKFIGTKFVANEFVAYVNLTAYQKTSAALSPRAFTIASYALCGFANIASVGIQIGVLSALAPNRADAIVRLAPSAMICGFISTMQAAGIAGMML